ncbi:MAG: hypothetical protein WB762_10350 [Candidatus Sulfotelmatobacter sp.]
MKSLSDVRQCNITRFLLRLTVAVSLCSSTPSRAQDSPTVPCSWPVEVTGHGKTNAFNPDTDATYWLMPVNTTQWKQMIVAGEYSTARFFSFVTYFQRGGAVDSIIDANLAPNPGSSNPFQPGSTAEIHHYTLTIDGNAAGSANHIRWGNTELTYVVYRVYVPDMGKDREGGVALPAVTLLDANGTAYPTQICSSSTASLPSTSLGPLPGLDVQSASGTSESDATTPTSCSSTPPSSDVVTFILNTSHGGVFPNPGTTYAAARDLCSQSGRVIVIRGKAAVYPNTYYGGSIFQPAIPGALQLRYWSLCNNKEVSPYPVVNCRADHDTRLDHSGYYTYVLVSDEFDTANLAPTWDSRHVTWLRWGDSSVIIRILYSFTG